jgi:hygromycin-B 7''-O-kinase
VRLPAIIDEAHFDQVYRLDFPSWRPAIVEIAAAHGLTCGDIQPFADGSNLVADVDGRWVVKVFPPFHRAQWESERRVLPRLTDDLPVPVPHLVAQGERPDGYTFVVVTRLPGVSLEHAWSGLPHGDRRSVLAQVGHLMAAVHALPVGDLHDLPPRWDTFLPDQIRGCRARHARLGAPAWVVDHIDDFVPEALQAVDLAADPVILTGEYTPFNLLFQRSNGAPELSGMIDLGDAMIGPPAYDLLGPAVFLAGGDPALLAALFQARGAPPWPLRPDQRRGLLALLLVHRFSNLDAQLRVEGWRAVGSLAALADHVFGG